MVSQMKNFIGKNWVGLVILANLVLSQSAVWSAMSPYVTIKGQLVGVSQQYVDLKTASGVVKVPRRAFKNQDALKPNSQHELKLPLAQLVYTNRTAQ